MKNIATALVKAQKAFEPARKSSKNPHFRSTYADLASCVDAVIDALNDNGIFLMQTTKDHDHGVIVNTVFLHESGEMIDAGSLFVPAVKNDAQAFGSALTYARRYSLLAACGIAPEDDDGNAATANPPKPMNAEAIIAKLGTITGRSQFEAFYRSTVGPFLKDPANSKDHAAVNAVAAQVGSQYPKEN